MKTHALLATLLAAATLTGCYQQDHIEGTRAESMTVNGRKLRINVGPTGAPGEWRVLVVRDTIVLNADSELERERGQEAARRVIERVCRGKPSTIVMEGLNADINYYTLFRCAA